MFAITKRVYSIVSGLLLTACIACILMQIVARYVLSISLPWTEEMARYALVAVTFLGAGCASATGDHLGAYFLRDRVPGRPKGVMLLFNNLVCAGFEIFLIVGSYKMYFVTDHIVSVTVPEIKLGWLYVAMGLGSAMMLLCTIMDIGNSIRLIMTGNTDGLRDGQSSPFMAQE